jgi:hypothetical protein
MLKEQPLILIREINHFTGARWIFSSITPGRQTWKTGLIKNDDMAKSLAAANEVNKIKGLRMP